MFDIAKFNRGQFENVYAKSLASLQESEKITKALLRDLSRSVLDVHHTTQDVAFINRLIAVLSPMNKKTAVLFFQAFSGFHYDATSGQFTKKDKPRYAEKVALSEEFLDDVNNNIWTWAERNIEIAPKKFNLADVTKYIEKSVKKANEDGLKPVDVLRAVLAAGIDVESILVLMDEMGYDAKVE